MGLQNKRLTRKYHTSDTHVQDIIDRLAVGPDEAPIAGTCLGVGCAAHPLAPEISERHMDTVGARSLRKLVVLCQSEGQYGRILAPRNYHEKSVDETAFRAYLRKHPQDGCPRLFGSRVCRTSHRPVMPILSHVQQKLWWWVSKLWNDDVMEGAFPGKVFHTWPGRYIGLHYVLLFVAEIVGTTPVDVYTMSLGTRRSLSSFALWGRAPPDP